MIEAGLFAGQRFELIDGDLIDKMGQNPPHANAIQLLFELMFRVFGPGRVRSQLPMEAAPPEQDWYLPEPDIAVLKSRGDYSRRHPGAQELLLVVEVADSTVRYDLAAKRDLYARAGVEEYWVLDLRGERVIVHRGPVAGRYTDVFEVGKSGQVQIEAHPAAVIQVSDLLA
jgi:Uma2 family endonuclease